MGKFSSSVCKLLKDSEGKWMHPRARTFNLFVDAYCKEGRMEAAENLVKLMIQRNTGPDVTTYKWLIDGYSLLGQMSKSREVFDVMRSKREVPNDDVYNSMLNVYFKDSNVEEAMHLFDEMMKDGVKLNVITYDTMGLFPVKQCTHEDKLSYEVPIPDECTFKIVLEGLCNNKQVEEAVSLFHSMSDKRLNSNIDLYNILIDGACKSGKLGVAKILYNDMSINKGLRPNVVTYAAMINGFCEEGLAGEAKELFLEMKEKGICPNNVTCNILLEQFLKNKQHDIVKMLFLEMRERGFSFDSFAFFQMIEDGFFKS